MTSSFVVVQGRISLAPETSVARERVDELSKRAIELDCERAYSLRRMPTTNSSVDSNGVER
jgi:hypothetical protein